jgi:hypothetical protein
MYTRIDAPMQLIRDTLHRSGPDIHDRARKLGLERPERPGHKQRLVAKRVNAPPRTARSFTRLARAADTLRRFGYTPVYAQRESASSMEETGLWVVGRKLMKPDELIRLADKYERG